MKPIPKLRKSITVTTEFVGFHCWPKAPAEVDFLRVLHRHLFKVAVKIEVDHSDRSVEFFICKGHLDNYIRNHLLPHLTMVKSMSCEMMAEEIFKGLLTLYGYNTVSVSVSEDGENTGTVEVYQ